MEHVVQNFVEKYDLIYQTTFIIRIIFAGVLGYLIGYERQNRYKGAGMRTHAIVAMGAALMMVISKYGFQDIPDYDPSRIAAQIVSGIGFLGAGVIFTKNYSVSGLTTAAGIWATAGVGMAIGSGAYYVGGGAGILLVLTQIILHDVPFLAKEPYRSILKVSTTDYDSLMVDLLNDFNEQNIRILNVKIGKSKEVTKVELDILYPAGYSKNDLILQLSKDERIQSING